MGGGLTQRGGGGQHQLIDVEDADKAPNFGAEGAEIFEKTVLFTQKLSF